MGAEFEWQDGAMSDENLISASISGGRVAREGATGRAMWRAARQKTSARLATRNERQRGRDPLAPACKRGCGGDATRAVQPGGAGYFLRNCAAIMT